MARDDVYDFRNKLWKKVFALAKKHNGLSVAKALRRASQDVWSVGIDAAWDELKSPSDQVNPAFDITWLTAFSIRLSKLRGKTSKARRIRR
jgi:hypothetical protein